MPRHFSLRYYWFARNAFFSKHLKPIPPWVSYREDDIFEVLGFFGSLYNEI